MESVFGRRQCLGTVWVISRTLPQLFIVYNCLVYYVSRDQCFPTISLRDNLLTTFRISSILSESYFCVCVCFDICNNICLNTSDHFSVLPS